MDPRALPLHERRPTAFFFELRHVPIPARSQASRVYCRSSARSMFAIRQGPFQRPDPTLQLLFFINLFRLLHTNHLSSGTIPILVHPFLNRPASPNPILPSNLLEGQRVPLQFPHDF